MMLRKLSPYLTKLSTSLHLARRSASFGFSVVAGLVLFPTLAAANFGNAADLEVFRPSNAVWYSQGQKADDGFSAIKWGSPTDVPVPGDYDGDRVQDAAVWRPENGTWNILKSSNGLPLYVEWGRTTIHPTGDLSDIPVQADFDGDGMTDIAVWRPDNGFWYVLKSSTGFDRTQPAIFCWGRLGDVPVAADYDGDGRADHAIFRSWENRWYIFESRLQRWNTHVFGRAGEDLLMPADYTGDGKADTAIYRGGTWRVLNSETGEAETFEMGFADSVPVPADYDGDGTTDFAVWRDGTWYIYDSGEPRLRSMRFGKTGDIPVNSLKAKRSIFLVP